MCSGLVISRQVHWLTQKLVNVPSNVKSKFCIKSSQFLEPNVSASCVSSAIAAADSSLCNIAAICRKSSVLSEPGVAFCSCSSRILISPMPRAEILLAVEDMTRIKRQLPINWRSWFVSEAGASSEIIMERRRMTFETMLVAFLKWRPRNTHRSTDYMRNNRPDIIGHVPRRWGVILLEYPSSWFNTSDLGFISVEGTLKFKTRTRVYVYHLSVKLLQKKLRCIMIVYNGLISTMRCQDLVDTGLPCEPWKFQRTDVATWYSEEPRGYQHYHAEDKEGVIW